MIDLQCGQLEEELFSAYKLAQKAFYKKPFKGKGEAEDFVLCLDEGIRAIQSLMRQLVDIAFLAQLNLVNLMLVYQKQGDLHYLRWRDESVTLMGRSVFTLAAKASLDHRVTFDRVMRFEELRIVANTLARILYAQRRVVRNAIRDWGVLDETRQLLRESNERHQT